MNLDEMNPDAWPWPHKFSATRTNLRAAYCSIFNPGAATNRATHQLYNSGSGQAVIVVRAISWSGGITTADQRFLRRPGPPIGTHAGLEAPLWAGERDGVGQHWYADSATALIADEIFPATAALGMLRANQIPLAVLPPGWSYVFQQGAATGTVNVSWYWEELPPDDPTLSSIGTRL
jgi:hypothetical protein